LYNEAGLHLDVIAERILALRGQPIATMKEQLAAASIKEARGTENANQMVSQLANDFEMLTGELTKAIEDAEKNEDQPSADMLIGIRQSIEKHTWMMKAYLG
jgi:starvation-inducible DNA-binding protein